MLKFEFRNVQTGNKMGVVYKLTEEIKQFILQEKRANPFSSCRRLSQLIEQKFQINVSKSSINKIVKEANLSMPVGRRRKKRRIIQQPAPESQEGIKLLALLSAKKDEVSLEKPAEKVPLDKGLAELELEDLASERECTGAMLLKAADLLINGSHTIAEFIQKALNKQESNILAKTEALVYKPLFNLSIDDLTGIAGLSSLVDKKLSRAIISSYLNVLQRVKTITPDVFQAISICLKQVRYIKANISDGSSVYLDGQFYTVWPNPDIPFDFSVTTYSTNTYVKKIFQENHPFVLFTAPGYDSPTEELFNLVISLNSQQKRITSLNLYTNTSDELADVPVLSGKKIAFIFGMWPWQFARFRRIKKFEEYRPYTPTNSNKEYFIAEIEIELSQPLAQQEVKLKGFALKVLPTEKTQLLILSNLSDVNNKPEAIIDPYLEKWPNLDECFQDFSHKIELFTYKGSSGSFFTQQILNLGSRSPEDIDAMFKFYLEALDLYVRCYFLPIGYEEKDFSTMKERFYSLKANLKKQGHRILVEFLPQPDYPFLTDLSYACHRLNEKEIFHKQFKLTFAIGV